MSSILRFAPLQVFFENVVSGANDPANRLRSRTCRWAGDAEGIKISVEHNRRRIKIPPPSVSPSFRRVRLRSSPTGRNRSAQDDTIKNGRMRSNQSLPLRGRGTTKWWKEFLLFCHFTPRDKAVYLYKFSKSVYNAWNLWYNKYAKQIEYWIYGDILSLGILYPF